MEARRPLWAVTNLKLTVYSVLRGRGYAEAASILGEEYSGILASDGWAPYQRLKRATLQTSNAHLLRRCREILETATRGAVRSPRAVKQILQRGLTLTDRRDARQISRLGLKVAHGRLKAQLERLLAGNPTNAVNRRFAKHLRRHRDEIPVFLLRPDVEATNWPAEQAIQPAVVNRKTCAGIRSERGARALSVLMSVLRTAQQQGRQILDLLAAILRDPVPRPHLLPSGKQLPEFFAGAHTVQDTFAFILTAWVAPVLVPPDLVNGALPLYLSRPFSRAEYLLGKAVALLVLLSVVTWVPGLTLFALQAGGGSPRLASAVGKELLYHLRVPPLN